MQQLSLFEMLVVTKSTNVGVEVVLQGPDEHQGDTITNEPESNPPLNIKFYAGHKFHGFFTYDHDKHSYVGMHDLSIKNTSQDLTDSFCITRPTWQRLVAYCAKMIDMTHELYYQTAYPTLKKRIAYLSQLQYKLKFMKNYFHVASEVDMIERFTKEEMSTMIHLISRSKELFECGNTGRYAMLSKTDVNDWLFISWCISIYDKYPEYSNQ